MRTMIGLIGLVLFLSLSPANAKTVTGLWLTKDGRSHVRIEACGPNLCGRIVWLREPNGPDGKPKVDKNNPNALKQKRPILRLKILSGFVKADAQGKQWEDGEIYNPSDGKTYRCKLTLTDADTLRVRGYVGISLFGKTQVWKRVE